MLKLLLTYLAICTILASTSSFAETPEPENNPISEPSKDRTIEPGKSFFGCPIGATEEEVVKKLGKPTGKLTPNKQRSSLLYGQNCMLEFWSGKLIGVSINREQSYGKLESEENGGWTLSNGIKLGMNLAEIKKILGELTTEGRNFYNVSYEDGGSLVLLRFSSKGSSDTKDLDAYELYGITIKSAAPFSIDPSRSFFDCEIGSTPEEVISKLGQPLRRYNLHDGKTALIYGGDCALLFWNNRLGGIDLQGEGSIRGELSKKSGRDYIDVSPKTFFNYDSSLQNPKYLWQLKNGLRPGMDLEQAKTILGDKFPAKVDKMLRYQEGDTLVTFRVSEQKLGSVHMEPAVIERSDKLTIDPAKSIFGCPIGSTPEEVISKLGEPIGTHNLGHGKSALVYGADCALLFWDGRLRGLALEGNGNLIHFGRFLEKSLPDTIHIPRFASYHIGGANNDAQTAFFSNQPRPDYNKFGFPRYSWRLTNGLQPGMHLEKAKLILGDKFPKKFSNTISYEDGNTLVTFQVTDQKLGSVHLEPAISETSDGLVINPSKSIFGCQIGSSSAEVVSKMGPPISTLDFMNGLTALIYSNNCAMLFWNKKLGGIQIGYQTGITTHRERFAEPNLPHLDRLFLNVTSTARWSFPNGIMSGMLWNEAKGRLAGKELRFERDNIVSFDDGPSTVTLFLEETKDRKIGAIRIQPIAFPILDTESTLLYEQLAEKKPLKDKTIVPGKSFFGCQIGATEQQVITKLGKPAAKIDSGNGEFSLLYGPGCAMEFWNGKLGGVTIQDENFNLSNGVTSGMNLAEIQKKLGDKFTGPTTTYREGSSLVRITALLLNPDSDSDNYANYLLSELRIEPVEKYLNLDSKNSIFDSKFGSTPEEVISKLGQPNGKYRLSDSKRFFLYGQSYLLMFDNNKLQAIAVESFFPDSIESRPSISHFSPITGDWQLKNGLRKGMELDRANEILGDKNREKERGSVFYREEDSTVNISLFEIDSKKELWSIYIESSTDGKDNHLTIDPVKSIFGCELGSLPDEVIKRLGQPLGRINLKNGQSALILREKCFLTFSDEKLVGAEIYSSDYISGEGSRFINENSSEFDYDKFNMVNLSLVNGIKIGMPLAEAKKRLGIKEKVNLHDPLKYTDGPSEVSFGLTTQFDDVGTIITSIKIAPINMQSK